jgi:hypothetical protein
LETATGFHVFMNWSSFIGAACAAPELQAVSLSSQDRAEAGDTARASAVAIAAAAIKRIRIIIFLPASNGTGAFLPAGVTSMGRD